MRSVGEPKVRGGFVSDFEPLEVDDADVLFAALPNLALFQFHGLRIHLSCLLVQERWRGGWLLLFAGGLLAGHRRTLLGGDAGALGLFLAGFLLVCFRGFIAHNVSAFYFRG
jgi:hypothetical protein